MKARVFIVPTAHGLFYWEYDNDKRVVLRPDKEDYATIELARIAARSWFTSGGMDFDFVQRSNTPVMQTKAKA